MVRAGHMAVWNGNELPDTGSIQADCRPCKVLRAGALQAGPVLLGWAEPLPGAAVLDTDPQESP